jgi:hypothetical protein
VSSIALDEGSPAAAAAIGLLGGFLMVIYAVTIARRARHLPRGVRDARGVGYPRGVVWDVAVDRRPDTTQLINRVGPFASLPEGETSRFLRRRRLGVLLAGVLLVVALLSPTLLLLGQGGVYFWFQLVPIPLAWVGLWWWERPERRYRKRFIRQETAKGRITVSRDITEAWLQAAGAQVAERGRAGLLADRVFTGGFSVAVRLVIVMGIIWLANLLGIVATFEDDPPGNPRTHMTALLDSREAARTTLPARVLDRVASDATQGEAALWSLLLRDSLHNEAHALEDSIRTFVGDTAEAEPEFAMLSPVRAREAAMVFGDLDRFEPVAAWRSLADSALPLLWYRDAIAHLRTEVEGDTTTVATNASRSLPLQHLHVLGSLELYRASFAFSTGDTEEALARAARTVRVGRNLLRDPLSAATGLEMLERATGALRVIGARPGFGWLTSDVLALEAFTEDFRTAQRTYGGRPAVKAMAETDEHASVRDSLVALAADTTVLPVHRRALARASVLGSCFQGNELFFGSGGAREELVEMVFEGTADLPESDAYAVFYRGLTWDAFVYPDSPRLRTLGSVFWVLPRVLHCDDVLPPMQRETDGEDERA